jgi:CheY-like chemotaxis protein
MSRYGPIIIIDDDTDDHHMIEEAFRAIYVKNKLIFFSDSEKALKHLKSATEQPFLILCDVNMPKLNGLKLRAELNKDEYLRKKSIPFVFFSTTAGQKEVKIAYEITVQGYFEKGQDFNQLKKQLKLITDYWYECKHPNSTAITQSKGLVT